LLLFLGSIFSYKKSQYLQNKTGYSQAELAELIQESAAGKLDPISNDPDKYKGYIDFFTGLSPFE